MYYLRFTRITPVRTKMKEMGCQIVNSSPKIMIDVSTPNTGTKLIKIATLEGPISFAPML